jgi:hypothetical protein
MLPVEALGSARVGSIIMLLSPYTGKDPMNVVWGSEGKLKAQEPKPKLKHNQKKTKKLFLNSEFLKS